MTAMTPEDKAKLCKAIGHIESDTDSMLPAEYVAIVARFKLHMLEVLIRNDAKGRADISYHPTVLSMQVNRLACTVKMRPAASGML